MNAHSLIQAPGIRLNHHLKMLETSFYGNYIRLTKKSKSLFRANWIMAEHPSPMCLVA